MTRLPVVSGRRAMRVFERVGFEFQPGRGKGSHLFLLRRAPPAVLTIPDHRELDRGTLKGLIRAAGLTNEQFAEIEQSI